MDSYYHYYFEILVEISLKFIDDIFPIDKEIKNSSFWSLNCKEGCKLLNLGLNKYIDINDEKQ